MTRVDGIDGCPRCACLRFYNLVRRNRFKCANCGHQYSTTSSTLVAYPKMPLSKHMLLIEEILAPTQSLLQASKRIGVNYRTAWSLKSKLLKHPETAARFVDVNGKGQQTEGNYQ